MQSISNEYETLNLCSYTHTHLHHRQVPLLGCEEKAAGAVVAREEEQVAAALLDEQLW